VSHNEAIAVAVIGSLLSDERPRRMAAAMIAIGWEPQMFLWAIERYRLASGATGKNVAPLPTRTEQPDKE